MQPYTVPFDKIRETWEGRMLMSHCHQLSEQEVLTGIWHCLVHSLHFLLNSPFFKNPSSILVTEYCNIQYWIHAYSDSYSRRSAVSSDQRVFHPGDQNILLTHHWLLWSQNRPFRFYYRKSSTSKHTIFITWINLVILSLIMTWRPVSEAVLDQVSETHILGTFKHDHRLCSSSHFGPIWLPFEVIWNTDLKLCTLRDVTGVQDPCQPTRRPVHRFRASFWAQNRDRLVRGSDKF